MERIKELKFEFVLFDSGLYCVRKETQTNDHNSNGFTSLLREWCIVIWKVLLRDSCTRACVCVCVGGGEMHSIMAFTYTLSFNSYALCCTQINVN